MVSNLGPVVSKKWSLKNECQFELRRQQLDDAKIISHFWR
jgi:hypothetical protein